MNDNPTAIASEKRCTSCASNMPLAAVFCLQCSNYQSWLRRNLNVSHTTLALLVAALALVGTAFPAAKSLLVSPNSSMRNLSLQVRDGGVRLVASNDGDRPGVLEGISIRFSGDELESIGSIGFERPEDPIVKPGEVRTFFLKPHPTVGFSQPVINQRMLTISDKEQRAWYSGGQWNPEKCDVTVNFVSFEGVRQGGSSKAPCVGMWTSLFPDIASQFFNLRTSVARELGKTYDGQPVAKTQDLDPAQPN